MFETFTHHLAPGTNGQEGKKKDLQLVFIDLANAFTSVPHEIEWTAFDFSQLLTSLG